jgi:beta-carotene hydroxylase
MWRCLAPQSLDSRNRKGHIDLTQPTCVKIQKQTSRPSAYLPFERPNHSFPIGLHHPEKKSQTVVETDPSSANLRLKPPRVTVVHARTIKSPKMLRNRADIRTVAFLFAAATLLVVQWNLSTINPVLYVWALMMAVSISAISHLHNHVGIWRSKTLNAVTDYWLTIFYGFPVFSWIPTHNQNHHKFNNRAGDDTLSYRFSEKNNIVTLLTYPPIAGAYQMPAIAQYLAKNWKGNRKRFWYSVSQGAVLAIFMATVFILDWRKAILFVVLPQQLSMYSVLIFNYIQHIHADEESHYDHSRNFLGRVLNWLLFNNGFHWIHHEHPGMHWSEARVEHEKVAEKIAPQLQRNGFWGYIIPTYIVSVFVPRLRSQSMRLKRIGPLGR